MFEKCSCSHCSGHLEFDAEHAGQMVACPHCGLETMLHIKKVPLNNPPPNVSVEIKRGVNPLGIASLVLGIGACVFCWIPFLGLLVIPFAAIGLLLAVIGITAAIVGKKSSLSFPVSGAIVCVIATLIALFVTGGISTLIAKHESQSNSTNQKIPTATTPQLESSGGGESWSKSRVVQQGDLQIKVLDWSELAEVHAQAPFEPGGFATYKNLFTVRVVLSNLSKTKKINFTTWRGQSFQVGKDYATLVDDNGNVYKKIDFGIRSLKNFAYQDIKSEATIYPQESFTDELVFELLVKDLKWLHLELPAENFGGTGMIRFEIPVSANANWRRN